MSPDDMTRTAAERGETRAVGMLIFFLAAWITTAIVLQVVQVKTYGYGGGVGDGGHVPPEVRATLHVSPEASVPEIMKETNR